MSDIIGSNLVPCDCYPITIPKEVTRSSRELEDKLFEMGVMNEAPCFICGYNGEGFYQPDKHKCAERHHKIYRKITK